VLLPPVCFPVVREVVLPDGYYERDREGGLRLVVGNGVVDGSLEEMLLGEHAHDDDDQLSGKGNGGVPFPTWDPDGKGPGVDAEDESMQTKGIYDDLVKPVRVTLEPGDMLYLPTMW